MNDFWKKYKIKIIIITYIVTIFSLIRFVAVPFVGKIKEKSDSIQEKIINNRISETRIGEIPAMKETLEKYQSDSEALEVILNSEKEVDFIKQMESIADATGNKIILSVGSNNTNEGGKNGPSNKEKSIKDELKYKNYLPMDIGLRGNYFSLVNFINKIENTDYYVNVISIRSKKTLEKVSSPSSSMPPIDVFSAPDLSRDINPDLETIEDKKGILESTIKIIIYTEK